MKSIQEYLEEASKIVEASKPSKFKPQLFHMSNLFGAKSKVMYHDGALWHETSDEGRTRIAKWNGNPNNRSKWNPASIDGEYDEKGKAKKWKEGYTFKDWLKDQEKPKNKDWKDPDAKGDTKGIPTSTAKNPLLTLDKAGADKAASEKIKRLIELLDALNESANVFRNAGILVERRLTAEEETEFKQLIKDLEALTKNPNLSNMNLQMAKTQLGRAKDAASAMTFKNPQVKKKPQTVAPTDGDPGEKTTPTDGVPNLDKYKKIDGSLDWAAAEKDLGPLQYGTFMGQGVENPNYKPPADDKGKDSKPKNDRTPSGSLKAFMGSKEGGIKNNPEEVEAIKELQGILNDFGFNVGEPDGDYGKMTEKGVKKFQAFVGLGRDGDAGPETIKELLALNDLRFSNDKTFGDFRRLMARMEKLIGKAGNAEESIDTSSMRGLIEAVKFLNEALSDADAKELQRVVDELADVYGDPSWQANLPRSTAKRFASNYKAAKGVLKDMGLDTPKASEEGKATEKNPEMSNKLDGKDGDLDAGSKAKVEKYTGNIKKDTETFYSSAMDKANAEAFVAAQKLDAAGMEALMDTQTQISRIMSVLNGNQRVPDDVNNPNGGKIVNRPEAVEVFRTFKDVTIPELMRGDGSDDPEGASDAGKKMKTAPKDSATKPFDVKVAIKTLKDAPGLVNDNEGMVKDVFQNQIKSKEDVLTLVKEFPTVWQHLWDFLNVGEMKNLVAKFVGQHGLKVPNSRDVEKDPEGAFYTINGIEPKTSQGPGDDVEAGVKSGGVAPMTADDAVKVINQFAEFKDEIMPQLSKEEQELFQEMLDKANPVQVKAKTIDTDTLGTGTFPTPKPKTKLGQAAADF